MVVINGISLSFYATVCAYDQQAFALVLNAHTMAALKKMWKYLQLRSDENHVMDVQRYGRTRIMISNMQKL